MHRPPDQQFKPWPRAKELALLESDDSTFSQTTAYLAPLINQALDGLQLSVADHARVRQQLLSDVPVAAHRFLGSAKSMAASYRFCAYFTWYIHERLSSL